MKKFSILNSQFSTSYGFTLIELVVVMGVLITIGVITVSVLINSLRLNNKTYVIAHVRDNGQYAITQMSNMIRYASRLDEPTTCQVAPPFPLAQFDHIKITNYNGGQTVFRCENSATPIYISSNSAAIINPDAVKIPVGACYFTCYKTSQIDAPTIGIHFELQQISSSSLVEQTAGLGPIPFDSSVTMRNIGR